MHYKHSKTRFVYRKNVVKLILSIVTVVMLLLLRHCATDRSDVVNLTDANFDTLVVGSGPHEVWLVEFYATWCPHCKRFAAQYEEVAKRLKGKVNVGAVDVQANKVITRRYKVSSFPKFKLFAANKSEPIDYQGPRSVESLENKALLLAGY